MRFLLLHPDDRPDRGPWSEQTRIGQAWDRVIDLGTGGQHAYERWEQQFRCPVVPIGALRQGAQEFGLVRQLLAAGQDRLLDREKLDWWGLTAILFHQQLETLAILRRFASGVALDDQVFVSRPGFHADALQFLLGDRSHSFPTGVQSRQSGPLHYARLFSKFPLPQLAEIFWDKYDASYAMRARLHRKPKPSRKPVVLLPSAYVNVSRTGIAYAKVLPETDFLLVATRRSGRISNPPPNVVVASLASYVTRKQASKEEYIELLERWQGFRRDLESGAETGLMGRLGLLDSFPQFFRQGLAIRDAWLEVLDSEPVTAVLCGDDSNPYTHIPMLLARNRGLPTLACHHGAFDGRHLIKHNYADIVLAKGRMEEDYLLRTCGLSPASVEIGAPACPPLRPTLARSTPGSIVFFSEAYEAFAGRGREFYRDLLPPLADMARETQRQLVVKLHPFESRSERQELITQVLSPEQQNVTKVISGPLTEDLYRQTWFGITILSTVAMECAMRGIPCFLCGWLEFWPYGYIEQFSKFGVGYLLKSAAELSDIPRTVESHSPTPQLLRDWWQPIAPARFQELLAGSEKLDKAVAI